MSATADGGAESWAVTSVGPRGEEWGRLIVPRDPADRNRATMVLERTAAALALHRMIERDRSGLHQQAQSGLIDDVLQGRITDEREAAARALALGLRKATPYFPVVVRVDGQSGCLDPVAVQRRNVSLIDAIAHTVNAAGHSGFSQFAGTARSVHCWRLTPHAAGRIRHWARWASGCVSTSIAWTVPRGRCARPANPPWRSSMRSAGWRRRHTSVRSQARCVGAQRPSTAHPMCGYVG